MLDHLLIQDVLDEALSMGADFAELYVEQTDSQTITMVGGKVDKANRVSRNQLCLWLHQ